MTNKYAQELKKERGIISKGNPFLKKKRNPGNLMKDIRSKKKEAPIPYVKQEDQQMNYFSLLLGGEFKDIELDIRGLRLEEERLPGGKKNLVYKRRPGHFLSEAGAEDLLQELKTHLHPDIKLAIFTRDEYLKAMDAIRKHFISFLQNNLYRLGMDTEEKQRNAPVLANRVLLRIRAVYSRSVGGKENERSHGDIELKGNLDSEREDRFRIESIKN